VVNENNHTVTAIKEINRLAALISQKHDNVQLGAVNSVHCTNRR